MIVLILHRSLLLSVNELQNLSKLLFKKLRPRHQSSSPDLKNRASRSFEERKSHKKFLVRSQEGRKMNTTTDAMFARLVLREETERKTSRWQDTIAEKSVLETQSAMEITAMRTTSSAEES
jgi:hypothetical protein